MTKTRGWDRLLWGIQMQAPRERPFLIGGLWDDRLAERKHFDCEPTRPILFTTRYAARAWCRKKTAEYNNSQNKDVRRWTFRPVRVRETVKEVK